MGLHAHRAFATKWVCYIISFHKWMCLIVLVPNLKSRDPNCAVSGFESIKVVFNMPKIILRQDQGRVQHAQNNFASSDSIGNKSQDNFASSDSIGVWISKHPMSWVVLGMILGSKYINGIGAIRVCEHIFVVQEKAWKCSLDKSSGDFNATRSCKWVCWHISPMNDPSPGGGGKQKGWIRNY